MLGYVDRGEDQRKETCRQHHASGETQQQILLLVARPAKEKDGDGAQSGGHPRTQAAERAGRNYRAHRIISGSRFPQLRAATDICARSWAKPWPRAPASAAPREAFPAT